MALETQQVAIVFTGGLDTKSDEQVVLPTKLIELDNGEFTKHGKVRARPGTFAFQDATITGTTVGGEPSSSLLGTKLGHATRGDELVLLTDSRLYSADEATRRWIDKRSYCPVTHVTEEIANVSAAQDLPSVAVAGDIRAVIWADNRGGVRYSVYNHTTGAAFALDVVAQSTASRPYAVPVGSNVLLLWADSSTSAINGRLIRSSNVLASVAAPVTQFVSDLAASRKWAVCTDDTHIYIAYEADGSVIAAGVGLVKLDVYADTVFKVNASADTPDCLDVAVDTAVNVVWSDGTEVKHRRYTPAGVPTTAEETVSVIADVVRVATGPCQSSFHYAMEVAGGSNDLNTVTLRTVDDVETTIRHAHLVSTGFDFASVPVFLLGHESRSGLQNSYYVYADTGLLMGHMLASTATNRPAVDHLTRPIGEVFALGFKRKLDVEGSTAVFTHNGISMVTVNAAPLPSFADVGGTCYLSGSCLWAYDGQAVAEANLLAFPDMLATPVVVGVSAGDLAQSNTGSGALTADNQYSYRVYYEVPRANGERLRSAALTVSITLSGGNDTVTLTIPTLSHTRWRSDLAIDDPLTDVAIVIYRSAGNDEAGIYQQVSSGDPADITGNNRFVYNNPLVDTVTFIDVMSDTDRESQAVDYQSRGEVEHIAPPGPAVVTAVADRVFLAGGGVAKGTIRHSTLRFTGEPAEFSDIFSIDDLPEGPGAITALSFINETLVAFRQFGISAVAGVGLDNTGSSGGFESEAVTTDVGSSGVSVVVPAGIMFASTKGIYLLDQSFNVGYIGAKVEIYNAQTYTGACVIPGTNQVVFTTSDVGGRSLMYDYHFGEWAAWTLLANSLVLWKQEIPTFLRVDGITLYRDTSPYEDAVFTDDSSPYPFVSRTGPLRLQDVLQGFARLRKFQVLGTFRSPHRLQVELFYDRDLAPFETFVWDPADVIDQSTWGDDPTWGDSDFWGGSRDAATYQFEHKPMRQKFSTISFRFSMTPVGTPGAGYELTELALDCGVKPGLQKHAATRKY